MPKLHKRIPKTSELMWIFGTVFMALGVCLNKKSDLGVSMIAAPTFILQEFLSSFSSFFSAGVTEYLLQGVILIVLFIVVRKFEWRFLLCFVAAIIYGYCLDLWLLILGPSPFQSLALRWVMLIVGDLSVSFGVACFFRTYIPLQIHELFVSEVSAKFSFPLPKTKWIYDLSFLALSVILAFTLFNDYSTFDWTKIYAQSFHSIGLATVITTLINTPTIKLCGFFIDKVFITTPLFPELEKLLRKTDSHSDKISSASRNPISEDFSDKSPSVENNTDDTDVRIKDIPDKN